MNSSPAESDATPGAPAASSGVQRRAAAAAHDAFVLHSYDWSESSLILEVFTRRHGRIALVAKGAKKPSSNFRPVLLPLQDKAQRRET